MTLFVRRREGGGVLGSGLPISPFLPGAGGDREDELLRPETARLITQLE